MNNNDKSQKTLRSKMMRILAYSTVYLVLNLMMQWVVFSILLLADSRALRNWEYRNYILVALNMFVTASLYSGILSKLEGGLEKFSLNLIAIFHKLSKAFIGVLGSLFLIYYLLFVAYYWNIFGENILPQFVLDGWKFIVQYFDLYIIQTLQNWLKF